MGESLRQRIDLLLRTQNDDGGWGYFPGKRSWLEPTAYAMLALDKHADAAVLDRAWHLVESWQLADGSWRPGADVAGPGTWVTALGVHLCCARGCFDESFTRGVAWLMGTQGRECNWLARFIGLLQGMSKPGGPDNDVSHRGWPWLRGTTSWVEPTAQAIMALKMAAPHYPGVADRVADAEEHLLSRRCRDGGWNYGSRRALGIDLPSYPETTALALLGLQGRSDAVREEIAHARKLFAGTHSRLARAWLAVALQAHGEQPPAPEDEPNGDILLAALEAIAHPDGNRSAFRVAGGRA
jgi:hypothetical protein